MITNQEVFNKAYLGLKAQEFRKSSTEAGACKYRNGIGDKCALGMCIPDSLYTRDMEGTGPDGLLRNYPEVSVYIGQDTEFLDMLQLAHDDTHNAQDMQEQLLEVAKMYNLTVPDNDNAGS